MGEFTLGRHTLHLVGRTPRGIENPAWDYVRTLPYDDLSYRGKQRQAFNLNGPTHHDYRRRVTSRWTWAIPDPATLDYIVKALDGRPVVEMGAGSGYWAWMLSQMGVDVVAYDKTPVGHEDSWYRQDFIAEHGKWEDVEVQEFFPVQQGDVEVLSLLDDCAERVLFLCWPNYDTDFAYEALKAYRGDLLVYIGEGNGGCTANWKFWALVEGDEDPWGRDESETLPKQEWEEVGSHRPEQWFGINDWVTIYKRKAT